MKMEIKKVQQLELEILREVHRVCTANAIPYYLAYGTMLGAVRHQGFIPWDDDIDILMYRPDYERFKEIARRELRAPYRYMDYHSQKNYVNDFAKVCDNRTRIKEETIAHLDYELGVYIDVFPLDGVSGDPRQARRRQRQFNFHKMLLILYYLDNSEKRSFGKRAMIWLIQKTLDPMKQHEKIERIMKEIPVSASSLVIDYNSDHAIHSKSVIGRPVLYRFEESEFYGVEDSDTYLKSLYGAYRELPPVEQRVPHSFDVEWVEAAP